MTSRSNVAATARRMMHSALEDNAIDAMRRQLASEVDLLARKFTAVNLAADGMTMFTAAAAQLMAASALPPKHND
jgi:hypothetical protein